MLSRPLCHKIFFLILLFTLPFSVSAQPQEVEQTALSDGSTLYVSRMPNAQTVSVNIFVEAGASHERDDEWGLAHFYEHMFFRGTSKLSGIEFKQSIEALGGRINATTSHFMTHYFIEVPKERWREALDLLIQANYGAQSLDDSVKKEREVVLHEYRIGLNTRRPELQKSFSDLLYEGWAPSHSVIGTKKLIESFSRAELLEWRNRYYRPERTRYVVVGDIDLAGVKRSADSSLLKHQVSFPDSEHPPVSLKAWEIPTFSKKKRQLKIAKEPSRLYFLTPGPSVQEYQKLVAFDLLSFLIGQKNQGMISNYLMSPQLLSYDMKSFFASQPSYLPGFLYVEVAPRRKHLREAIAERYQQLTQDLMEGKVTQEEILSAKSRLTSQYLLSCSSPSGWAHQIGFYATLGEKRLYQDYLLEIEKIGVQELMEVAKEYLPNTLEVEVNL